MKSKILPYVLTGLLGLSGCDKNQVTTEHMKYSKVIVDVPDLGFCHFYDVDDDKKVDVIFCRNDPRGSTALDKKYTAEGYEDKLRQWEAAHNLKMTPEMREYASQIFQGVRGLEAEVELKERNIQKDNSNLPKPKENQKLIIHPDGYTLLTDLNYKSWKIADWDVAEEKHAGGTPGSYSHKFYFKKGFTPSQSLENVEFVEPKFFDKYK